METITNEYGDEELTINARNKLLKGDKMKINALVEYQDEERAWMSVEKTDNGYVFEHKGKTYALSQIGEVNAPILKVDDGQADPPKFRRVLPKIRPTK